MSRHAGFAGFWCVILRAECGSIGGACVRLLPREPADASVSESTCFAAGSADHAAAVFHRAGLCHVLRPGRRDDRAHYFFARARWELDELGLAVARLAVLLAVPPGADLEVAVDDSVFRRWGRKVHGAGWQHDGSSPSLSKLSYGNCFVTAGIVVRLPFCARAVCLPVLARLHLPGKGKGPGKVAMAAALISQLGAAFGDRTVHVVADAAYHGPALRTLPRRILAAATEEFTKHGIAGARVDRIAAAANSNKAMLYAYFGNKEQLFEAAFA